MRHATTAVLLVFFAALTSFSQSNGRQKTIQELQQKIADAYKQNNLASLDGKNLVAGSVKVVIEHSLVEGKNGDELIETRQFKTLAAIDAWIKKRREDDNTPFNEIRPLLRCSRGRCAYNFDGGIDHNHLYLHDVYYGFRSGRPYITRIHLLDGD